MAVKLDTVDYLQTSTAANWGTTGTIFFNLFHFWPSGSGSGAMLYKSEYTPAGKVFYFELYGGQLYAGWFDTAFAPDTRLVVTSGETAAAFPGGVWERHLFDWDSGANLQRYYAENIMRGSRSGAFNVTASLPYLTIGSRYNTGVADGGVNAYYAEFGRWDRILTDFEKASLQATGCPIFIPNGLVQYHRMLDPASAGHDAAGLQTLTIVGSPAFTGSTPSYTAAPPLFIFTDVAAAATPPGSLTPPLLSSTITLYAPSLALSAPSVITPPLLSSMTTLFPPSLSVATMPGVLTPPLLSSTVALYAPTISVAAPAEPIGISTYPPTIDTAANLLIAANNKQSTLTAELSISNLVLTVADASSWPASGALTLDVAASLRTLTSSEIVYYNGRNGNTLTLTARAVGGTTAKVWVVGTTAEMRGIAEHHNLHSSAIIALQTEVETKADNSALAAYAPVNHSHSDYAPISHAHPNLPLSGGTLTGPLILAGPPVAGLHAATKAYVDSMSGGEVGALLPNTYLVTQFNASGVMATTTGSITSGSNQLTVADASTYAVGQGVSVIGAGASAARLVALITAIAGSILTLDTTASTTVTNQTVLHDDTTAIQTAINTVIADGGGELLFPGGYYRCNGPLQASNSVLRLPYISPNTTPPVAIKLTGLAPISWFSWEPAVTLANNGVIIQSDVQGANADSSLFAAALWDATTTATAPFTHIMIYIDQIRFRTYTNPNLSGLDLGMAGGAALGFVSVETAGFWEGEPTHVDVFGLRMPRVNTVMAMSRCDMAYVHNYYIGCILSEMPITKDVNFFAMRCKVGFKCLFSYYPIAGALLAWQCPTSVHITDDSFFDVNLSIEQAGSGWNVPVSGRHIYDPSNKLHGLVRYSIHDSGTGTSAPISNTGATAVAFTNLRA